MSMVIYFKCLVFLVGMASSKSSAGTAPRHGIYLSVIKIDHTNVDLEASILIKVFADDLRNVIRAANKGKVDRSDDMHFCALNQALIEVYFQENFSCWINERTTDLTYKTGYMEGDVYWLQFNLTGPSFWEKIRLHAPFFTEIFSNQSNILQIQHGKENYFARLTKKSPEAAFDL